MSRVLRPIPPNIGQRFRLSQQTESGLEMNEDTLYKKEGDPAGSKVRRYWYVPFEGSTWQAHRVVAFLRHGEPGNKVVCHTDSYDNRDAIWTDSQKNNLSHIIRQPKGCTKLSKYRVEYKGRIVSLHWYCKKLGLNYQKEVAKYVADLNTKIDKLIGEL